MSYDLLFLACVCGSYMPLFVSAHVLPQSDGDRLHLTDFQQIRRTLTASHQTQPERESRLVSSNRHRHGKHRRQNGNDQGLLRFRNEAARRVTTHVLQKSTDVQNRAISAFEYYCLNVEMPDPSNGPRSLDSCERFIASSDTQRNLRLPEVHTFDGVETVGQLSARMNQVLQVYEDYKAVLEWILRTRESSACYFRRHLLWQRCNDEMLCEGLDEAPGNVVSQMRLHCHTVQKTQSLLFSLRQLKHVHVELMNSFQFTILSVEAGVDFPEDFPEFALHVYTTAAFYMMSCQARDLLVMATELLQLEQQS